MSHKTADRLVCIAVVLLGAAVFAWAVFGCAVRRWENRIQRVEDAMDTTERVTDKAMNKVPK